MAKSRSPGELVQAAFITSVQITTEGMPGDDALQLGAVVMLNVRGTLIDTSPFDLTFGIKRGMFREMVAELNLALSGQPVNKTG